MNQPVQSPVRKGLGRGLGSLIPTAPPEPPAPRAEENDGFGGPAPTQGRHSAGASGLEGGGVATLSEERPAPPVETPPA